MKDTLKCDDTGAGSCRPDRELSTERVLVTGSTATPEGILATLLIRVIKLNGKRNR
ncbi:MAG: hypothetical protein GX638_05905 [Crenarchaeota archaeon]|nr:hypothetical protein [Thermoproteota archaeon]